MRQLNREQELAAGHRDGPMLVLAGPGSGKTAVLTERIRRLIEVYGVSPERILVLTFSKEAAGEMRERFSKQIRDSDLPVHFGTFHAVFYHILKRQGLYNENSILNQKTKKEFIAYAGKKLGAEQYRDASWQENILSKISVKKNGLEPEFATDEEQELFERLFSEYCDKCRREKRLDFDDMITECIRLLTEIPKVLKKWQDKYDHILVDEFQDIDLKQYRVLLLLAGEKRNIFAVGDDDQSIYGFRGACPSIMKKFMEEHKDITVVNLVKNYRSSAGIVNTAVSLIKNNTSRIEKRQEAVNTEEGVVSVQIFKSSAQEAVFVADKIEELRESKPEISIGVLYRMGRCPRSLEDELKKRELVYHKNEAGTNYFEEDWVKDILSYFRLASEGGRFNDLLRILNRPERGLSREAFNFSENTGFEALLEYYADDEDRLMAVSKLTKDLEFIRELPAEAALNYVLKGAGYERELEKRFKEEALDEAVTQLYERTCGHGSITGFIDLAQRETEAFDKEEKEKKKVKKGSGGGIILQTAHASKGLEYDAVFVICMQEGFFPHKKAATGAEIEEERRLFYVAMTRARKELYICGIRKDDFGKKESRFIHELPGRITGQGGKGI